MPTALRQAARSLARRPLFSSLLFGLLSLGVSAFGAMFVLVNATTLRPLPFADAERLYRITALEPGRNGGVTEFALSNIQFQAWRAAPGAFDRIEAWTPTTPKRTGDGETESLRGAGVSGGLFELIGATAVLGRSFRDDDDFAGSDVAMLSYGYWQRRFGGDPSVIGTRITLDDVPRTVIGVTKPGFTLFYQDGDVWTPLALPPTQASSPTLRILAVVAHLRAGATAQQGEEGLAPANATLAAAYPNVYGQTRLRMMSLRERLFGAQQSTVLFLFAAVVLVLLIASANALNLAFADALGRRTATMTRLALGASRRAIVGMRVAETAIIGVAAAIAGVFGAQAILGLLSAVNPAAFDGLGPVGADVTTIGATVAIALVVSAIVALPVALAEAGTAIDRLAGTASRAVGGRLDRRHRRILLASQVALTVVLLCCTTLLMREVQSLLTTSPGFDALPVLVVPMTISSQTYSTPVERANHVARMLEAVRALPGVESASSTQSRFVLQETMQAPFDLLEFPSEDGQLRMANIRHSTDDLAKTLGMRVVRGRPLDDTDRIDGQPVAMVSESFAQHFMPGVDPVGKHIRRASETAPWMEIVGVVNDVMDAGLGYDVGPAFYVSYLQQNTPTARVTFLVRAAGDPAAQGRAVRDAIWSVDRRQTIESTTPLAELMSRSAAQPRLQALVGMLFAGAALALMLVGIYAVTLHDILRQAREYGVRSALGAQAADLLRLTLRNSLTPVVAGIVAGAAAMVPAAMWTKSVLGEGFARGDAPVLAAAITTVLLATASAALVAGRRVTRIDALIAMRMT